MHELIEQTDAAVHRKLSPVVQKLSAPGIAKSLVELGISDDVHELIGQPPARLHYFFERQCERTPEALALVCGSQRLSYAQLDSQANRLARFLIERAAGPGKTVGVLVERSVH